MAISFTGEEYIKSTAKIIAVASKKEAIEISNLVKGLDTIEQVRDMLKSRIKKVTSNE